MKTMVLPGYATKNKTWAYEVKDNLEGLDVEVYEWKHWTNPELKFHPQDEARNLKNLVGDPQINIVAKSIGTLVAAIFVKENPGKVNKIVFAGVPVNDMNEDDLHEYKILSDLDPAKITVFQNSDDEHGKFEEVRKFLAQYNPNIEIVERPGSTHDYPFYDDFKEFLKEN